MPRRGGRARAYASGMALEWEQVNVDATDPEALGRWRRAALDWVIVNDDPEGNEFCVLGARRG